MVLEISKFKLNKELSVNGIMIYKYEGCTIWSSCFGVSTLTKNLVLNICPYFKFNGRPCCMRKEEK